MKDMAACWLEQQTPLAAKWCQFALLKEAICGLAIDSCNKAGYNLPVFDLLLASPNPSNSLESILYPCYVQKKEDGCRMIRMPNGIFLGRNGRTVPNKNLNKHIETSTSYVLDGEFVSDKRKFNDIVSIFKSEDKEIPEDIKFVVFNAIPLEDWSKQNSETTNAEQLLIIQEITKNSKNIEVIENYIANSPEEVFEIHNRFLAKGYEGSMVKNITATYAWERVRVNAGIMLKLKQMETTDGKIVGYFEGEGRNQGRFGGFIVELEDRTITRVGGGIEDKEREEFWKIKDTLIGQWIIIKFTEKTEDNNLRFPIFKGLRDSKD